MFGVAREEVVRISCEVESNPVGSTTFEWRFNASGEIVDMPHDRYIALGQKQNLLGRKKKKKECHNLQIWHFFSKTFGIKRLARPGNAGHSEGEIWENRVRLNGNIFSPLQVPFDPHEIGG